MPNLTRSSPVAHRQNKPGAHEFRVRFTGPLRDVRLIRAENEPVVSPPPSPQLATVPVSIPPSPPTDFWTTDAGQEMQADRERIETVLNAMQANVAALHREQSERLSEWQNTAVELALTIATRILHERVNAGEFPIDAKVRDMIAQLGEDEPVIIRLNPADLKLLNDRLGGESLTADNADPRLLPDASLGRGACQVEGRESMLISDVPRELQEIRDELLRSMTNARS